MCAICRAHFLLLYVVGRENTGSIESRGEGVGLSAHTKSSLPGLEPENFSSENLLSVFVKLSVNQSYLTELIIQY